MVDTTFASDNLLRFKCNIVERIQKVMMTTDNKSRDKKLKYGIKREVARTPAIPTGKIDEYENLSGEKR